MQPIDKPKREAKIVSINISGKKGKKYPVKTATIDGMGIKGDAHSGDWHRQLSMLSLESIGRMNKKELVASPGDFGENITAEGLDFKIIHVGDIITFKKDRAAMLEVTQIGKECKRPCKIFYDVGFCVMPLEGIFLKVLKGGMIENGDVIRLVKQK
jgi:MOSC domain-containing protein YiiM